VPHEFLARSVPQILFCFFQLNFAVVSASLLAGSVIRQVRFKFWLILIFFWSLLVHDVIARWVWAKWGEGEDEQGWLKRLGFIDYAGGLVVHVTTGCSALAFSIVLRAGENCCGDRCKCLHVWTPNKAKIKMPGGQHSQTTLFLGAVLLLFGWFGFNGGSALRVNGEAAVSMINCQMSAAGAVLIWILSNYFFNSKFTSWDAFSAMICGLIGVTAGSGLMPPICAFIVGMLSVVLPRLCFHLRNERKVLGGSLFPDTMDVFTCHALAGAVGVLAVGVVGEIQGGFSFSETYHPNKFYPQLVGLAVCSAYAFVVSAILMWVGLLAVTHCGCAWANEYQQIFQREPHLDEEDFDSSPAFIISKVWIQDSSENQTRMDTVVVSSSGSEETGQDKPNLLVSSRMYQSS